MNNQRLVNVCFQLVILFIGCTKLSLACGGYKLRINKLEGCGGDVITIDSNFTADLTEDCEFITNGCVHSKGFQSAEVKYTLAKNGLPIKTGTADICKELEKEDSEVIPHLKMIGFPTQCPFEAGTKCTNNDQKVDISKYKKYLSLARGKEDVSLDITHDTGKSCFKVAVEFYK